MPVTETGPDGETTVLPANEWIRGTVGIMWDPGQPEKTRTEAQNFVAWEGEYFAWKRDGEHVPRRRVTGKVQRGRIA